MNSSYPPLSLNAPIIRDRRRQRSPVFFNPELTARRLIRSQEIRGQIAPITKALHLLTPAQRRAVFLKLNSARPLTKQDLAGTGLRILAQPTDEETLVVSDSDDDGLNKLEKTITRFGEAPIKDKAPPPSAGLAAAWKSIYLGEPIDRLAPELRKNYQRLKKTKKGVLFELEIITYETGTRKQRADLESNVLRLGNALANEGVIYEADYGECGVRVCLWATGEKFRELVEAPEWQRTISFFEARPQFETYHSTLANFKVSALGAIKPPSPDAPIICVIDSGVAPGNPFLGPVVRKDLCKSYLAGAANQPWDELGHGSAVASLAAYYALSINKGAVHEAKAWIASARILNADGMMDKGTGDIESDRIAEAKLLSLTLKTIVDDYVKDGIRIFVLAFTVKNRMWNKDGKQLVPRASWLARTIDQLSRKHGVVFVTITGNASEATVAALHKKKSFPGYLSDEEMKIEDPAQSALSITVGSIAHSATVLSTKTVPIAKIGEPSPFTRSGPGLGGAIKPDVVERGGNSVYDPLLKRLIKNLHTEVLVASHSISPAITHGVGTSLTAPRAAHHLAIIQHDLLRLGHSISGCLLRALLVNSSNHTQIDKTFFPAKQKNWFSTVGYGLPQGHQALEIDDHNPLLVFDGTILPDKVALFEIPLPSEMASVGEKRFRITVAYEPQVQQYGLQSYLGIAVKFRLFTGDKAPAMVIKAMSLDDGENNAVTEQEEDFPGALTGIQLRSRSTIQHDVFRAISFPTEWNKHPFTLAVSLTEKWGGISTPIPVAIVVRIQDTKRASTRLYAKLAENLARSRVRVRS